MASGIFYRAAVRQRGYTFHVSQLKKLLKRGLDSQEHPRETQWAVDTEVVRHDAMMAKAAVCYAWPHCCRRVTYVVRILRMRYMA
jgi:hypothetical protein